FQIKKHTIFLVGWTSCPPITKGGRDAHSTRRDNLFLGNPLELSHHKNLDSEISNFLRFQIATNLLFEQQAF
ncbi:hypothetical protein, partial [Fischerella sp.]|uniref:hypothetical protein n=1 Tax=Fischerella sp. TaxID=1191 RepID=UPI0025C0B14C